ncbi:unnamed protein product [Lymnaea stagnalis]|uniref:Calponin-homology (CH) domain-containing protein n=1 Tax=Lymnaea stagnalis TaxID=6523 RepID=A0AAV2I9K4_LYMST
MSMRTKIRGMTAWVNFRLLPYDHLMSNVLMDLLTGTGMKYLVKSITGRDIQRVDNMDGLTTQQVQTRVNWVVDELKKCDVLPQDAYVDSRLFAMRSSDQVFDLLWRLISHDIWFLWERVEFLQQDDPDVITQVPFKWTPDPPPHKKKKNLKKSLLSGFGASAFVENKNDNQTEPESNWIKFPNSEFMKNFKQKRKDPDKYPSPEACILEIINTQLKKTSEGKKLACYSLDDLVDSRVLCALVNSFVPNTFTTDLLLNDRWTVNLVLRTAEKMLYADTPFSSEDLAEADGMAVTSYFTFLFMVAFKYRQCQMVASKNEILQNLLQENSKTLQKCPTIVSNAQELQLRKDLKSQIEHLKEEIDSLAHHFDIKYCTQWVKHVHSIQLEVRKYVKDFMVRKFDCVTVPRNITISDLCLSYVINLSLSKGSGFYLSEACETLTDGRRLVLKVKETGEFIDDFTSKNKLSIKQLLGITKTAPVDINPKNYPKYDFYFEALSRNKYLKAGSIFLYQVFPGNSLSWEHMFIKAARENELDRVERMVQFFPSDFSFINSRDTKTGQTALHMAARHGHFDIVQLLLENGANIDAKDNSKCTPIFSAIEGLQKPIAHLLLEWGCDVHCRNLKGLSPFEAVKNDEFRQFLVDLYEHYSATVPKIMKGSKEVMEQAIRDHRSGERQFCSLHSRCINGSTLLHTASFYGYHNSISSLLQMKVNVNLKDFKGATPLQRAKDHETLLLLLENGAEVGVEDAEGNTCLHTKCYGEIDRPTDLKCISLLLEWGASVLKRNKKNLLPIHCCIMQGRVDAAAVLLGSDKDQTILKNCHEETTDSPPSLLYLAVANNFLNCAQWLIQEGFNFKEKEQDVLLHKILMEKIKVSSRVDTIKFLLQNGADANPVYEDGNSTLHQATMLSGPTDVLEVLLAFGAQVDHLNNEGSSPLMMACKASNPLAARLLINNGANMRQKNIYGHAAFDHIEDFEEWINSGYFSDDIVARLKGYNLKQTRDLIRSISQRVQHSFPQNNAIPPARSLRSASQPRIGYRTIKSAPPASNGYRAICSARSFYSLKPPQTALPAIMRLQNY